jgi:uncharacterized protein (DUF427 family)
VRPSETHTTCHWKGIASYYDVMLGDDVNKNGAWYYPDPFPAVQQIKGRVACWHGVEVRATES